MVVYALISMSVLLPVMTITAFVIGYNVNAQKKILKPKPKPKEEKSENEIMIERINNARV